MKAEMKVLKDYFEEVASHMGCHLTTPESLDKYLYFAGEIVVFEDKDHSVRAVISIYAELDKTKAEFRSYVKSGFSTVPIGDEANLSRTQKSHVLANKLKKRFLVERFKEVFDQHVDMATSYSITRGRIHRLLKMVKRRFPGDESHVMKYSDHQTITLERYGAVLSFDISNFGSCKIEFYYESFPLKPGLIALMRDFLDLMESFNETC